jgi:uncharacterized protein (DUF488 family)
MDDLAASFDQFAPMAYVRGMAQLYTSITFVKPRTYCYEPEAFSSGQVLLR